MGPRKGHEELHLQTSILDAGLAGATEMFIIPHVQLAFKRADLDEAVPNKILVLGAGQEREGIDDWHLCHEGATVEQKERRPTAVVLPQQRYPFHRFVRGRNLL